jgi:hypothetical protein
MADNNGPRNRKSRTPTGPQLKIEEIDYQISFDVEAFDNFIRSQGIWITHYRAVPDPRGMASLGDNRDVLNLKPSDSDGFVYRKAGRAQVLFTSNNKNVDPKDLGEMAFSTAYITLPRYYEDGSDVVVHSWDKFYLEDIEIKVTTTQYVEANKKGVDRLQYPAVKVTDLLDANGVSYEQDKDFNIGPDGEIIWLTQRRPGWNATIGKGVIYSIRYLYTPYFVVSRHLHEIRVSQVTDKMDYSRSLERMPYQVQVLRENVFLDNKHPNDTGQRDNRQQIEPNVGGGRGPQGLPSVSGTLGPKP